MHFNAHGRQIYRWGEWGAKPRSWAGGFGGFWDAATPYNAGALNQFHNLSGEGNLLGIWIGLVIKFFRFTGFPVLLLSGCCSPTLAALEGFLQVRLRNRILKHGGTGSPIQHFGGSQRVCVCVCVIHKTCLVNEGALERASDRALLFGSVSLVLYSFHSFYNDLSWCQWSCKVVFQDSMPNENNTTSTTFISFY